MEKGETKGRKTKACGLLTNADDTYLTYGRGNLERTRGEGTSGKFGIKGRREHLHRASKPAKDVVVMKL